ncbi:MAG: transglutaminase domain-containing protein [Promethearchaeota archaeon]
MARSKLITPKNIIKVVGLTALVMGVYMFNSVLIALVTDPDAGKYDRSQEGSETDPWDEVTLHSITFDPSAYIDALLNSDMFAELSLEEQLEVLQDMLGEDIGEYLEDAEMSPGEFLATYDEELEGLLESLGGDSFSSDFLDQFDDPALVAVLLAKPMFYAAGSNPSNPWNDQEDTLFKTKSFDRYDLTTFDWGEGGLGVDGTLFTESDDTDIKFHIKAPIIITQETIATLYSNSPSPRIMTDSIDFDPILTAVDPSLKSQSYLGGAWAQMEFEAQYVTQITNISYDLLYDDADYPGLSYYDGLGLDMGDYTALDQEVMGCMNGPYDGTNNVAWTTFRANNPNFNTVATELASYPAFTVATTTYAQMQAIINYIGENFVYNPLGDSRPPDGVEPIEWFSQSRESQYPFEFSSLSVALARLNGISSRYVTGYKSNEMLTASLGFESFYDPVDELTYYPYLVGNIQTWVETFVPTSSDDGDWVPFDMVFSALPVIPESPEDVKFNLRYNDLGYYPDFAGYERFDEFDIANTLDIELTYEFNDDAMGSQSITLYDVTYDEVLDTGYTDVNGQITFTLNLDEITVGAHVLNVTTEYYGFPINNITIINVLDDIEIVTTLDNTYIVSSPDTPQTQFISGYAFDVYTGDRVANVELNYTGVKLATEFEPIPEVFSVDPNGTITNQLGNFSSFISIPGFIAEDWGSEYTIFTNFYGVIDISADIAKFDPIFQTFFDFLPSTQIPAHLAAGYTDMKDSSFWMYNDEYVKYDFYMNTTRHAHNTTFATYDDPVIYGTRADLVLNFTAVIWEGYNYSSGTQINVYDHMEGNRLVTSFLTDANGYGTVNYAVSGDSATDWTAGPHLLEMSWSGAPNGAYTYFYVVITEAVLVDQTSEIFTGGTGGLPALNVYYLNNELGDPYDSFTMTGNMQDIVSGENLTNYQIHYQVRDKNGDPWSDYFLQNGVFNETVTDSILGYSETFNFYNFSSTPLSPFRTEVFFSGIFVQSGNGWNSSWNAMWMPYYQGLPTTFDSSDGVIEVIGHTVYAFNSKLNDVDIPVINATILIPDRQYGVVDSLNFSCEFLNDTLPLAGANITLYNVNTTETLYTTTDALGEASFVVSFGPGNLTGLNKFLFSSSYDNGVYVGVNQTYIEVIFNETKDYNFNSQLNFTSYDVLTHYSTRPLGIDDSFRLSGVFNFSNGVNIIGASVNITDINDPSVTQEFTTDGVGYFEWILAFGFNNNTGLHRYSITVNYPQISYTITESQIIEVFFDEELNFNFTGYYNSTDFTSWGPQNVDSGYTLNIDAELLLNSVGFQPAMVYLTDSLNETTWSSATNTSGEASFVVYLGSNIEIGVRTYNLTVIYLGPVFDVQMQRDLIVDFDPSAFYDINFWNNDTGTTRGSGEEVSLGNYVDYNSASFDAGVFTYLDLGNATTTSLNNTGSAGNRNLTIFYGAGISYGVHTYRLNFTFQDVYGYIITQTIDIGITFNPDELFSFTPFDNVSDTTVDSGDEMLVTLDVEYKLAPFDNGTVYLNDTLNAAVSWNPNSTVNGLYSFNITFGYGMPTGTTSYLLNFTYLDDYGYLFAQTFTIANVNFNPTSFYTFTNVTNNTLTIKGGDTVTFDTTFLHDGSPILPADNATVYLTNAANSTFDGNYTVDLNGDAFFSLYFGSGIVTGDHAITLLVEYTDTYGYLIQIEITGNVIDFQPLEGYRFLTSMNVSNYDQIGIDEPFTIEGGFEHNSTGAYELINGGNVTLTDLTEGVTIGSIISNNISNVIFIVEFNQTGLFQGWHLFQINVSYTSGGYIVYFTHTYNIFFNASKGYTFDPWDSTGSSPVGTDDPFDVSVTFSKDGGGIAAADVNLVDLQNLAIDLNNVTDGDGYANFTIYFAPGNATGWHNFQLNITFTEPTYGYVTSSQIIISVFFNETQNYEFTYVPLPGGTVGSDDTLEIETRFLSSTTPVPNGDVIIKDPSNAIIATGTTDANGWANFTLTFGPGNATASQTYAVEITYDGITYTIDMQDTFAVYFDYSKNYLLDITDDFTGDGTHYGTGDTLQLDSQFLSLINPVPGAIINITDSIHGLLHSAVSDGNGWVNYTVVFGEDWNPGAHTITVDVSFDGTTYIYADYTDYVLYFNHTMNYAFVPYDDINGLTQTFGDSIEISGGFYLNGAPHSGADVVLTDLTNGTTWLLTTDGNGYVNFTINFNADVYPGGHHYQMDLTYDATAYTINALTDHWVFYQNNLTISAGLVGYTANMTLDQSAPFDISVQGNLVDSNNSAHGHLNALLSVYIYSGITDVSDLFSYNYVVNSYNDNTNGAYDIDVFITSAPQRGEYTIIVGFNGSLDTVDYTSDALPVNSTDNAYFWVYQNTTIVYDYVIDNSDIGGGSGIIIGGSDIIIFGNLTDSEGNALVGLNITLVLYDDQNSILATFTVSTNSTGGFEFTIENCPYDLDSILLLFDGNYLTYLNPADDEGGPI